MSVKPTYFNVDKTQVHETTWDEVFAAAARIKEFFDLVKKRFPGRDEVLTKMMYAFMTRHHLLMTGPHGTAKTLMIETVLKAIEGPAVRIWRGQLTRTHTEDNLFGTLNIFRYRDTGKPSYDREDTLATAHFARIGEFWDANDGTLRSLLGAIHEREISHGGDYIENPLLTALADTNFRLEDDPASVQQRVAVLDRYLFQADVNYLTDPGDRIKMFTTALGGTHQQPMEKPLLFHDIVLVSGLVHEMNLVTDPYVVSAYEEATRGLRDGQQERNEIRISDRRLVQGLITMEAYALLQGRTLVNFEDVHEAEVVLCGTDGDRKYFTDEVPTVVTSWVDRADNRKLQGERDAVTAIVDRLPTVDVGQMESEHDLADMADEVKAIIKQLEDFDPEHAVIRKEVTDHIVVAERRLAEIQLRWIAVLASSLPEQSTIEDAAQGDETNLSRLHSLLTQVKGIRTQLTGMTGQLSDAVRTARRETTSRCIDLQTAITDASGFLVDS